MFYYNINLCIVYTIHIHCIHYTEYTAQFVCETTNTAPVQMFNLSYKVELRMR